MIVFSSHRGTLPGSWVLHLMLEPKQEQLHSEQLAELESTIDFSYEKLDGMGFCLSEDGDLLSQWRGYADDGKGLSIGFRSEYFRALSAIRSARNEPSFSLTKLVYDEDQQMEAAKQHMQQLRPLIDQGACKSRSGGLMSFYDHDPKKQEKIDEDFRSTIFSAMFRIFEFKSPAFKEEREWRLIRLAARSTIDSPRQFRACGPRIIPYNEVELEQLSVEPVACVTLGPKHDTPVHVVTQLLESNGFSGATVQRSSASYR